MGQEKRRNVGGEVPQPGRDRLEGAGRGDTAVRRLGGDRVERSLTPHCYLVARTYKKWGMRMDDSCLCGEGAETFLHMQLACKLKGRRAAIQGAHDDVMRVLEEEVKREAPPENGRRFR
jgi:hypothetical protein